MYKQLILATIVAFSLASCGKTGAGSNVKITNLSDSISYLLGAQTGMGAAQQIAQTRQGVEKDSIVKFNMDIVMAGLLDGQDTTKLKFKPAEMEAIFRRFQVVMQKKMAEKAEAAKAKWVKYIDGEKAKDPSIKATESGLHYKVVSEGKAGEKPTIDDTVTVNYTGKLTDGTEFDASKGKPFITSLANVVPGWTEGIQLMKAGDKIMLYIPSELGYGEQGSGEKIGPNQPLVFEVELISFKKGKPGSVEKAKQQMMMQRQLQQQMQQGGGGPR